MGSRKYDRYCQEMELEHLEAEAAEIEFQKAVEENKKMTNYTVILLYPMDYTDDLETYTAVISAEDPNRAVYLARLEAAKANNNDIFWEDFRLLVVLLGEPIIELNLYDGV